MSPHSGIKAWTWTLAWLGFIAPAVLLAQSPDLPAGPVQAKLRTACTECHDSHIIVQQRLSGKAWSREVDKMIKWGAVVDPNDRTLFIDYLTDNFPPEKAPEPGARAVSEKKK
jgi:hypothetical protein